MMGGQLTAPDGGPQCPPAMKWALIESRQTGELTFCNPAGQRFTFEPTESAHLAVVLADHCDDNDERGFVAGTWGPIDEEETEA